ncbi:ABC transporter permease [Lactobacillus bombicola]|uniref:ABC transporter permease n=1 Tax=Lactobacillus bombicola TaxID=1505723 RepID=UPI000E59536A|nr:ABC transporter permease [Lactobacillus bombicola]RHW53251.1 hypothetical protein DS833_00345 [Lactobacillus bombicola]
MMINIIKANFLKNRHSKVIITSCTLSSMYSILSVLIFLSYENQSSRQIFKIYNWFFLGLVILSQFALSIFIPFLFTPDKEAGNYAYDLRLGVPREKIFVSKYIYVSIILLIVELISVVLFTFFEFLLGFDQVPILQIILLSFLVFIFLSFPICIYLIVNYKYSYNGTLLIGVIFSLSGILLGTTALGTNIWHFFPWTWGIVACEKLKFGLFNRFEILKFYRIGVICIFLILIMLLLSTYWFKKAEIKTN